jgi:hypothetical protein
MVYDYVCIYVCVCCHFLHTNTVGSSVFEMDLKDNDVILVCGIVLCFTIQIKSTFSLSQHNFF